MESLACFVVLIVIVMAIRNTMTSVGINASYRLPKPEVFQHPNVLFLPGGYDPEKCSETGPFVGLNGEPRYEVFYEDRPLAYRMRMFPLIRFATAGGQSLYREQQSIRQLGKYVGFDIRRPSSGVFPAGTVLRVNSTGYFKSKRTGQPFEVVETSCDKFAHRFMADPEIAKLLHQLEVKYISGLMLSDNCWETMVELDKDRDHDWMMVPSAESGYPRNLFALVDIVDAIDRRVLVLNGAQPPA